MIYDISPPVSSRLPVWPGDTPPSRDLLLDIARGDHLTLSTLRTTVHVGAHADAPSHYGDGAPAIDAQPLDLYVGRCQVIHVDAAKGSRIAPGEIDGSIEEPRVLLATGTYPDPLVFDEEFAALEPGLIGWLADRGVRLVGVDTPSVDTFHSKRLPAHHECLSRDVAILEGLVLTSVPSGTYELIALPLRLVGFDASPVRAVLRTLGDE
ncbi:MAG: cyclase family protein [Acidobacteriota bacterium]|nr:cyclase family protein [Acidobacteriota bacterium]